MGKNGKRVVREWRERVWRKSVKRVEREWEESKERVSREWGERREGVGN